MSGSNTAGKAQELLEQQALDNLHLLRLLQAMPLYVQYMVATGEQYDSQTGATQWKLGTSGLTNRKTQVAQMVTTLHNYGWTEQQISTLLTSNLPLLGITEFQKRYKNRVQQIQMIVAKIRNEKESVGHVLPRLLDPDHWGGAREAVTVTLSNPDYLQTQNLALHRVATFAQEMYTGQHSGHYLVDLPMGTGKTTKVLVPFVIHCAQQNAATGLIIAMQRREDIQTYAQQVNDTVGRPVAFALFSHDPQTCSKTCLLDHKEWGEQANDCLMLFLTHEMLSRRGVEPYRQWSGGKRRVMVLIDEKPGAWWGKGVLTKDDLLQLQARLYPYKGYHALCSVLKKTQTFLQSGTNGEKIGLQTQEALSQQLLRFALVLRTQDGLPEEQHEQLQTILDNVLALSLNGGILVTEIDNDADEQESNAQIIVSRQRLLPSLPTLILDATGTFDPEYTPEIRRLAVNPWEGKPMRSGQEVTVSDFPAIHLLIKDRTLSRSSLEQHPHLWKQLQHDIQQVVAMTGNDNVYIIIAEKHEQALSEWLKIALPKETETHRIIVKHYGETRGSNGMRKAAAIIFATVQFKPLGYYRALALARGVPDITGTTVTLNHVLRFRNPDLEELKVREIVVTLLQEIGRTRIREGKPICIYLPWADEQGRAALKAQLKAQFLARVEEERWDQRADTREDKFLKLLTPGTHPKADLRDALGYTKDQKANVSQILGQKSMKKELWGRGVTKTHHQLIVPEHPPTELLLAKAEHQIWQAFALDVQSLPVQPDVSTLSADNQLVGIQKHCRLPLNKSCSAPLAAPRSSAQEIALE